MAPRRHLARRQGNSVRLKGEPADGDSRNYYPVPLEHRELGLNEGEKTIRRLVLCHDVLD